jgi:hypothetical protein
MTQRLAQPLFDLVDQEAGSGVLPGLQTVRALWPVITGASHDVWSSFLGHQRGSLGKTGYAWKMAFFTRVLELEHQKQAAAGPDRLPDHSLWESPLGQWLVGHAHAHSGLPVSSHKAWWDRFFDIPSRPGGLLELRLLALCRAGRLENEDSLSQRQRGRVDTARHWLAGLGGDQGFVLSPTHPGAFHWLWATVLAGDEAGARALLKSGIRWQPRDEESDLVLLRALVSPFVKAAIPTLGQSLQALVDAATPAVDLGWQWQVLLEAGIPPVSLGPIALESPAMALIEARWGHVTSLRARCDVLAIASSLESPVSSEISSSEISGPEVSGPSPVNRAADFLDAMVKAGMPDVWTHGMVTRWIWENQKPHRQVPPLQTLGWLSARTLDPDPALPVPTRKGVADMMFSGTNHAFSGAFRSGLSVFAMRLLSGLGLPLAPEGNHANPHVLLMMHGRTDPAWKKEMCDWLSTHPQLPGLVLEKDAAGGHPLHEAMTTLRGGTDFVEWLLDNGANPNAANNRKDTPLHRFAAASVHAASPESTLSLWVWLMDKGFDASQPDRDGLTPVDLLRRHGPRGFADKVQALVDQIHFQATMPDVMGAEKPKPPARRI